MSLEPSTQRRRKKKRSKGEATAFFCVHVFPRLQRNERKRRPPTAAHQRANERVSWRLQWPSLPALVSQRPVESSTMTGLRHTIEAACLPFSPGFLTTAARGSRALPEMARALIVSSLPAIPTRVSRVMPPGPHRSSAALPLFTRFFPRHMTLWAPFAIRCPWRWRRCEAAAVGRWA